jgi:hypothetical protein
MIRKDLPAKRSGCEEHHSPEGRGNWEAVRRAGHGSSGANSPEDELDQVEGRRSVASKRSMARAMMRSAKSGTRRAVNRVRSVSERRLSLTVMVERGRKVGPDTKLEGQPWSTMRRSTCRWNGAASASSTTKARPCARPTCGARASLWPHFSPRAVLASRIGLEVGPLSPACPSTRCRAAAPRSGPARGCNFAPAASCCRRRVPPASSSQDRAAGTRSRETAPPSRPG